ncbi:MAG: hypothetical protein KAR40_07905 [Candidatus Sabulitectum sp.]|nr:hypothetical protein [Candidatus Sabulitectum sp.]
MDYRPGNVPDPVLMDEFRRISDALDILYGEGLPTAPTSVSDPTYTTEAGDRLLLLDATSNDIAVTMTPAAAFEGRCVVMERMDLSTTYDVTLTGDGGELIEDVTTQDLYPGESMKLYSDGSNWRVL